MRRTLSGGFIPKTGICLAIAAASFLGIALMPGKLEGIYRGQLACACGSVHLSDYREGRVILYGIEHPPAEIVCRYETDSNNVSTIYWLSAREGEPDRPFLKAYPHLLITRFVKMDDGSGGWDWKWPVFANTRKAMNAQEITTSRIRTDGTPVTTYYDLSLKPLKTEEKPLRSEPAEKPAGW